MGNASFLAAMSGTMNLEATDVLQFQRSLQKAANGNTVSRDAFEAIARSDFYANFEVFEKLFIMFDRLGDSVVNYREFCAGLCSLVKASPAKKLNFAFQAAKGRRHFIRSILNRRCLGSSPPTHKDDKLRPAEALFVLLAINNMADFFGDRSLAVDDVSIFVS